ncbi:MAG: ribbon-helix-helix domain-containing protein [Deltaproteobacteria bacterium]|jgi:predicted DNA-binding protein|nr:ribbon-helix-helix domain-containing protein [Deltaproteobacteria bacterium]
MLAVRLDEQVEKELDMLAKALGTNRSEVVREAIFQYLEDNEDLALAKQAERQAKGSKPLAQLRKELGLDG